MYSLSSLVSLIHTTQSEPLSTMVMPIMPPTHECVVETGISRKVASSSQKPTAPTTARKPYMSMPGSKESSS